ncbi:hypothetical protein LCGC14_2072840 [marine sediment metagenome]|uniref:Uncharacterized protein n=1 Tax=marine sediment metagenome TaxID=412755 RepID=A0A0F9EHR4_9ZZZZ
MLFKARVALVAVILLMFLAGVAAGLNLAPTIETKCPPQIEAATRVRLFFLELPPDLTDQDNEFSELCGLNWGIPVRIEPLGGGA